MMNQKYLNVLSFKNGKTLAFQTDFPFSYDKTVESEWNIVTDERTGQILSFRSSEIVTIASLKINPESTGKKKGLTTKVVSE